MMKVLRQILDSRVIPPDAVRTADGNFTSVEHGAKVVRAQDGRVLYLESESGLGSFFGAATGMDDR